MSRIGRRFPMEQIIKGHVTKVNATLLYFEISNECRVYVDLTSTTVSLPGLNDYVKIVNPKKVCNAPFTAIIGPNTVYKFPTSSPISDNAYLEVVRALTSDVDELLAMDLIARRLELFLTDQEVQSCIKALYHHALTGSTDLEGFTNCTKSLKAVQTRIPKDLQYANSNSELYTFLNFDGQCAFNVYPSRGLEKVKGSVYEYLFGNMAVVNTNGHFTLRDDTAEILVKFTSPYEHIYKFHNNLVLIKNYTVFTEIYKDRMQPTLHYILLNTEDVVVLSDIDAGKRRLFYGINELPSANFKYSYFLQASKISEVIYGYNNGPECWMEGRIFPCEDLLQSQSVYVILPNELLEIAPFLKEHVVYKIFTGQKFKFETLSTYRELYGMKRARKVILLNGDSVFQETQLGAVGMPDKVLEDFHEVKSHIASVDGYTTFSFVLRIERKLFQPIAFASWFPRRHQNLRYFGDVEKHQTILIFRDAPTNSYIDLYLSNRENHVIPLGLVSHVKVKVRHVQANKRKYLKATIFTSFEIVEYCPDISFSSVNLLFSEKCFWRWRTKTPPTLMGMHAHIPVNCVVHGPVLFRALLDLRLEVVCVKCRQVSREKSCGRCKAEEKDVSVFMVIHVQDSINPTFHMETHEISFLLELLRLRNKEGADAFFEECLLWDRVDINFLKIPEGHQIEDADSNPVLQRLVTLIRSHINYKFYFLMDVVCVKQFAEGRKPWKLVDFDCVS